MNDKSVATEEILSMIAEISTSLDHLENAYGEAMNTARCKLWANQHKLVNEVQEAMEKAGEFWVENENVTISKPVRSINSIINPKILAEV
ncbi:hypothetical protein ACQKL5_03085 [Peribacillus sp. NPDC097675]|uniref:hypothetical protein n=1 Tax=Peribacillus sp. NPDC097675 TaxID=3390618 RepID=UPI003D03F969